MDKDRTDRCMVIAMMDWPGHHDILRRVYSSDYLAPTIPTGAGGNVMPKIAVSGGEHL